MFSVGSVAANMNITMKEATTSATMTTHVEMARRRHRRSCSFSKSLIIAVEGPLLASGSGSPISCPMLLNDIVEVSRLTGEVSGRLAKIDLIAACLRRARGEEIEIAVAWLSGGPRQ